MMERIPVILEQIKSLQESITRVEFMIKKEIADLKSEHIMDLRRNICRIWLKLDDINDSRNHLLGGLTALHWLLMGSGAVFGALMTVVGIRH
jgi:hypothetical protein